MTNFPRCDLCQQKGCRVVAMVKREDWRLTNPMYAIVRTGGKQYRAEPGKIIDVEKLPVEAGSTIDLAEVLLVAPDAGDPMIGRPLIEGTVVRATVVEHYR